MKMEDQVEGETDRTSGSSGMPREAQRNVLFLLGKELCMAGWERDVRQHSAGGGPLLLTAVWIQGCLQWGAREVIKWEDLPSSTGFASQKEDSDSR